MSGPFVLVPLAVTTAMLTSSTITEPAAGETVWAAATTYTVGQQVIRVETHRIYENLIAGANSTLPENAPTRWLDVGPTNRWAVFDSLVSSPSVIVTPLTMVIRPGFFNSLALYGLDGATVSVSVKTAPAGTVFYTKTIDLIEPPLDYYDYYFGAIRASSKAFFNGILPQADPELTITVSAGAGIAVKAGMIAIGNLRSLMLSEGFGGTLAGAKAKPITYSYISTDAFGNTKIIKRAKATDLDIRAVVPKADADAALLTIQSVLDIPAVWIASDQPGYGGLSVFGLASGDVTYEGPVYSTININVKGLI